MRVLEVLRHTSGYLSLSDIAAETGLDASTVHRLLQALTENGTPLATTCESVTFLAPVRFRRYRCFIP